MSSILSSLEEVERMLRSDGYTEFADIIARTASEENSGDFSERISSLDIWGGTGSIVDVTLSEPKDERRFKELIVDLAEALDQLGIGTPRTRWVGQTIEDWLIVHPN